MFRSRKYKSGSNYAFWRWTDVDSEYITRLHVIKTPWNAICVHWLHKPDPEPYLHDHPVSFLSIILRGWYVELRWKGEGNAARYETRRWFNWINADRFDRHTIVDVAPKTVTLCFMGPKTREWGFDKPNGWQFWKDYYAAQRASKQKTQ